MCVFKIKIQSELKAAYVKLEKFNTAFQKGEDPVSDVIFITRGYIFSDQKDIRLFIHFCTVRAWEKAFL